jgi:hypothetical protein
MCIWKAAEPCGRVATLARFDSAVCLEADISPGIFPRESTKAANLCSPFQLPRLGKPCIVALGSWKAPTIYSITQRFRHPYFMALTSVLGKLSLLPNPLEQLRGVLQLASALLQMVFRSGLQPVVRSELVQIQL